MRKAIALVLVSCSLVVSACATQRGPSQVTRARAGYNEALVRSWDEQLLLNLVRLRYRDNPLFLGIGSVVTQYAFEGNASAAAGITFDGDTTEDLGIGGSVTWSEKPTVTFTPLQGTDFVTQLLSPIAPSTLVLLSQSGWSIERLLLCCVQWLNGIQNAVAAAGPTPDYVPPYEEFQRVAATLRRAQVAGDIEVELSSDDDILIRIGSEGEQGAELRRRLGLSPDVTTFRAVSSRVRRSDDEIAVVGRSLLGALFFLSQGVEPPPAHVEEGLVTLTRTEAGEVFDWSRVTEGLLRIRSSAEEPANAAVKVPYRGHWYWIADDDLNSKTSFGLLYYLFSLKAGSAGGRDPLLTLGVQ